VARKSEDRTDADVIRGEFVTDGKTFIFSLAGTPLSGTGASPQEAYAALLGAQGAAGELPQRLAELAREQQGEKVRAGIIQLLMVGLIALGVVGGALVTTATLASRVMGAVTSVVTGELDSWLDHMPPERERKLGVVTRRVDGVEADADAPEAKPETPAPKAPAK
jgi:hypothetical protein